MFSLACPFKSVSLKIVSKLSLRLLLAYRWSTVRRRKFPCIDKYRAAIPTAS